MVSAVIRQRIHQRVDMLSVAQPLDTPSRGLWKYVSASSVIAAVLKQASQYWPKSWESIMLELCDGEERPKLEAVPPVAY